MQGRQGKLLVAGAALAMGFALTAPLTGVAQTGSTTPGAAPRGPCANHVMGQSRANWGSDAYMCEVIQSLQTPDEIPSGINGGVEKRIVLPRGAEITKVHVYADARRVYGLRFSYKLNGGPNDDEVQTDVIGGTSGEETVVEVGEGERLHFIRPQFGPDPASHYRTPVLTGLDVGVYTINPLAPSFVPDPTRSFSHEEMIEVTRFGTRAGLPNPPPLTAGFNVHLVQVIRGFNACVSPLDRNGRIFALGVATAGMGPRQTPNAVMCPPDNGVWAQQPLGPKRLAVQEIGRPDPYRFRRGVDDAFEFASGIFTREGAPFTTVNPNADQVDPNKDQADLRGVRYIPPLAIIADFGDTAIVRFAGETGVGYNLPLITDRSRWPQDGTRYDFVYGNGSEALGVEIESVTDRDNPAIVRNYAYMTFTTRNANGARFNGRYQEARIPGRQFSLVAKREVQRSAMGMRPIGGQQVERTDSLFSLGSVQSGYGYIYSGYDPVAMSLLDPNPGMKAPIFADPGPTRFYISDLVGRAVNEGLFLQLNGFGISDRTQTIMASESEVAESVSRTISADVNVRGVKAGAEYSRSQSRTLSESANSVMGFGTAQYYNFTLILDRPNLALSDAFIIALRRVYLATTDADRDRAASSLIATYGTHFANAVTFGGMGYLMTSMTAQTYAARRESGESFGVTAGVDVQGKGGGTTSFRQETTNRNNNSGTSSIDRTSWRNRGGMGSLGSEAWNVSAESSVPILYDLRPLTDLVEPLMLSRILDAQTGRYDAPRALATRAALNRAIEARFALVPPPSTVSNRRELYRLTINGIRCTNPGGGEDRVANKIQLFGDLKIQVVVGDDATNRTLFESPNNNVELTCDGVTNNTDVKAAPVFSWRSGQEGLYVITMFNLTEDDNGISDFDDSLRISHTTIPDLASLASGPQQFLVLATPEGQFDNSTLVGNSTIRRKPTIYLDLTWERLE